MSALLIRKGLGSFCLRVGSMAAGFVTSVVLARMLGVSGYGVYTFCFSLVQFLVVFSLFGLEQLCVREVSIQQSSRQWGRMRGLLTRTFQGVVLLSLISVLVLYALAGLFSARVSAAELAALQAALLLVPCMALLQAYGGVLRGLRSILLGQLPMYIIRPALFLLGLGLVYFSGKEPAPSAALYLHALSAGAALLLLFIFVARALPRPVYTARPVFETGAWIRSAWPLFVASGTIILNNEISILMLRLLADSAEVGLFRVAQRGSMVVLIGLQAVNMTIAPSVSGYYSRGETGRLQRLVTNSARANLLYALPVALVLILGAPLLVPFVFGRGFAPAAGPLAILTLGQLINVFWGSVALVLNMTGHERHSLKGILVAALVNAGLNLLLIPPYGALGAALAALAALFIWNLLLFFWVRRLVGISTTPFFFNRAPFQ